MSKETAQLQHECVTGFESSPLLVPPDSQ